ncbi:MAG TPA: hypothetical protein VF803_02510, partial [Candidatus Paceibacterota bacterium]
MALISKKRVWAMIAAVAVLAVIVLGVRMIGVKHLGYDTRPIATVSYACDEGKTITASFYRGESQAPPP